MSRNTPVSRNKAGSAAIAASICVASVVGSAVSGVSAASATSTATRIPPSRPAMGAIDLNRGESFQTRCE